jgi:glycosyltransferase involved in cell wall biosynthesis
VDDRKNGLLVPPADAVGLAAAVAVIASEPAFASTLGAEARRVALVRHSPRRVAEATMATYRTILDDAAH